MTVYGSPNVMTTPSVSDTLEMALQVMHGVEAQAGYDIENADYILSFGSGLIEGWGSPVRMFRANSAWKESRYQGCPDRVRVCPIQRPNPISGSPLTRGRKQLWPWALPML